MTQLPPLEERFAEQEQELRAHQAELEQQNEVLRQTNLDLEEARGRYADLFEYAPVGYVICDGGGVIVQINAAGCGQLGAAADHVLGRRFALFVEASQRPLLAQFLEMAVEAPHVDEPAQRLDLRMVRAGGEAWDAQLDGTALNRPGRLTRVVLTDVTALKDAQRSTQRHAAQAAQLHQELQTFLRSMTHDLSAPQRQVEGFTELLGRHLQTTDAATAKLLKNLLQATRNLSALTTSLTDFYRSGQPGDVAHPLNLNRLVEVIFRELEPQRRGRQISLTHDPLPSLQADHQNLHLVFSNLLANAVKFTAPRAEAHIHVGVETTDTHYLFSVRDNGVGFDPRQEPRLFGVFERLHSDRDFPGQGLGLALVRRIVERWQGTVWAENVPGGGAAFWVQVPRSLEAAPEGDAPGRGLASPPQRG